MAKTCENCGEKIGFLSEDPYYLTDDKTLCWECAKPIRDDINSLYHVKSKTEFLALKEGIIKKSQELYNETLVQNISNYIDSIYNRVSYMFETQDNQTDTYSNTKPAEFIKTDEPAIFRDIGRKIKILAQVIFWAGIIASALLGLSMFDNEYLIRIGFTIMIFGILISLISSFTLYGLGELIDNSKRIINLLKK